MNANTRGGLAVESSATVSRSVGAVSLLSGVRALMMESGEPENRVRHRARSAARRSVVVRRPELTGSPSIVSHSLKR